MNPYDGLTEEEYNACEIEQMKSIQMIVGTNSKEQLAKTIQTLQDKLFNLNIKIKSEERSHQSEIKSLNFDLNALDEQVKALREVLSLSTVSKIKNRTKFAVNKIFGKMGYVPK